MTRNDYDKIPKKDLISMLLAKETGQITAPSNAYYSLLKKYVSKKKEHFIIITLDGDHKAIRAIEVSIGTINKTLVHPREVFYEAIKDLSAAIIIAHNHPSGEINPSPEDDAVTQRIKEAGKLLGIPVLDHIVFGKQGYYSYTEHERF